MTYGRYIEIVKLSDRLIGRRDDEFAPIDTLMSRSLTKPERKVLMGIVCKCHRCGLWFDQSPLAENVKYCAPCGKATV